MFEGSLGVADTRMILNYNANSYSRLQNLMFIHAQPLFTPLLPNFSPKEFILCLVSQDQGVQWRTRQIWPCLMELSILAKAIDGNMSRVYVIMMV